MKFIDMNTPKTAVGMSNIGCKEATPDGGVATTTKKVRRALFLFASDRMNGAERITRILARQAASSRLFDHVHCFVLHDSRTGTLEQLLEAGNVSLHYTGARTQTGGMIACIRMLVRDEYAFVFSSQARLNAMSSALRGLGLLQTQRLVTRESTMIFDRDFGWRTRLVAPMYRLYGWQDLIVCQSDRMRDSLCANTRGLDRKCIVLPNPVDVEQIRLDAQIEPPAPILQVPSDRVKVVWCGRLVPVKAPHRALATLRALHGLGYSRSHLVMIGSGPLELDLRKAAVAMNLSDYVTFVGFTPRPASVMARCDVGLLTSEIEGFPNVVLEMLAAGVRGVATTDCAGGLAQLAHVSVAPSMDPGVLAQTLVDLLKRLKQPGSEGCTFPTPKSYLEALEA